QFCTSIDRAFTAQWSASSLYWKALCLHRRQLPDCRGVFRSITVRCAVICNFNQCHAWALDTAQDICHVYQNIDPQDTLSPAPASVQTFCSLPEHECFPLGNSSSSVGNSSSSSGSSSSSSGSSSSLIREHDEPIPLIE
ncbi:hypothetical protein Hamer_G020496, partial [Homarus americanus]